MFHSRVLHVHFLFIFSHNFFFPELLLYLLCLPLSQKSPDRQAEKLSFAQRGCASGMDAAPEELILVYQSVSARHGNHQCPSFVTASHQTSATSPHKAHSQLRRLFPSLPQGIRGTSGEIQAA